MHYIDASERAGVAARPGTRGADERLSVLRPKMDHALVDRSSYFRWDPWLPLGVAVVALVSQVEPWWRASPDGVAYLSVSRSLWEGGGLRALGEERLHQSPGYAVVLAPLWGLARGEASHMFRWVAVLHFVLGVGVAGAGVPLDAAPGIGGGGGPAGGVVGGERGVFRGAPPGVERAAVRGAAGGWGAGGGALGAGAWLGAE